MVRKSIVYLFVALFLGSGFTACDDKDEVGPDEKVKLATNDFYVLCRGNQGQNNASLGYYDAENETYKKDIFLKQNGEKLGELAEQMLIYGSKIYITMYGSNSIIVTDMDANMLKVIRPDGEDPMGPRGLASYNGKVFVGYQYGHAVAVLDTLSFEIEEVIPVGRYPEQMAVSKGKLFVANSGGLDWENDFGYGKTVSVIDLSSFTKEEDIEVVVNPSKIVADKRGDLYLISMGNYGDILSTLQKIDGTTYEVKKIGNASLMTLVNDELYTVYAQATTSTTSEVINYVKYNASSGEVADQAFIMNDKVVGNPYSINVDPKSGMIYISHFVWQEMNDMYVFDKSGNEVTSLDVNGYDVAGVWFRP